MSQEIVLIDIPTRGRCRSWSVNVLKTRIILNFKNIPYTTKWEPYVNLQQTLKATGVEPNPEGSWAPYTVPVIQLPDGSPLMDSMKIASKLEELYPQPPLHLDTGFQNEAEDAIVKFIGPLIPYFMPLVARDIVVEEDVEWFHKDRSGRFGMSMDQLEAEKGGDAAWQAAEPGFKRVAELLTTKKKDEGPFIMGSTPCFGDLVIVAAVQMFKAIDDEAFERIVGQDPSIRKVYEASKQWVERDD